MNTLKYLADSLRPSCRIKLAATFSIIHTMRSKLIKVAVVIIATTALTTPAMAATSVLGADGQKLIASITKVKSGQEITVSGAGFDETVGIYLAYCLMPKKGAAPTPCGGGVNKEGIGDASYWISSNAPSYATGLAIAFTPGGRFTEKVRVTKKIGKNDCSKVRCAITVRSDHLHEGDRTNDLFIPITFKK
jgi:hypothetical protein